MTYLSFIPTAPLNAYIDDLYYLDGPASYPRQKVLPVAASNLMMLEGTARSRHLVADPGGRASTSNGSDGPSCRVLRSRCPAETAGS